VRVPLPEPLHVPARIVGHGQSRTIKHALQQHTRCMSAGARAEWACEHMPCGSLLTGETSAPPHASLGGKYADSKGGGNQICWRYEVCAGGYTYDGKCDGTYSHSSDGARVPIGDVAIERGRTIKHALQQHTRCMSAGARAEWACEHMPCGSLLTGETSAPACFPRR